jgi:hypothetical protein
MQLENVLQDLEHRKREDNYRDSGLFATLKMILAEMFY